MQRDFGRGGSALGGHSEKEHKILCMNVCSQWIRAYFGMSVEWERLVNARVCHRNGNCSLLQSGRQGVTSGLCMAAFDTNVLALGWAVGVLPPVVTVGATCRWFAGDVPEAPLIPAHPAASLDCSSLEDVLRCQETPEPD